jgi:hypothetical protein
MGLLQIPPFGPNSRGVFMAVLGVSLVIGFTLDATKVLKLFA